MLIEKPAIFIKTFIDDLNINLMEHSAGAKLTRCQMVWLGFCLTGMLLMNSVCWAKFERAGMGTYRIGALSWVFRKAKINWYLLFIASVKMTLKRYGITGGTLVLDESDRTRSKSTKRIHKAYKQKHKSSGGYVNGQTVVMLLLVTDTITVPVGFVFYMPDPAQSIWKKEDERLKKSGVKKNRPSKPARNPLYPTKLQLALGLLEGFKENYRYILVKAILGDALYGEGEFIDQASNIFDDIQVISQLRENQNIWYKGKMINLKTYFNLINKGVKQVIIVRGVKKIIVMVSSARLKVDAHGKKRFVVALKYEGEEGYRYIVATDMSWRTQDIIQAYTLRWLIEVFFEDWKLYEGWGQEAKQLDEEGSSRGVILSLLLDHCLLLHPEQMASIENKLPACTVGSLQRRAQMDVILEFIKSLLEHKNVGEKLKELGENIKEFFELKPSTKHMSGKFLGRLEPTPSLKYRANG